MDSGTDDMVKSLIRKEFTNTTVLTIAHRLDTVQDYDKIMVFDAGLLKEFDSPHALLKNPESQFAKMSLAEKQN